MANLCCKAENFGRTSRIFIGIRPPEAARKRISEYQLAMRSSFMERDAKNGVCTDTQPSFVGWTPEESLHLTLHFVGSVSNDLISVIRSNLDAIKSQFTKFSVSHSSLGFLPKQKKNMRVIYLGLEDRRQNLQRLATEVQNCVADCLQKTSPTSSCSLGNKVLKPNTEREEEEKEREWLKYLPTEANFKKTHMEPIESSDSSDGEVVSKVLKSKDKKFFPHITLGRLKKTASVSDKNFLANWILEKSNVRHLFDGNNDDTFEWEVNSFILFESSKSDNGLPYYKTLEEFIF